MKNLFGYVGTALAALAASACCWIPALLGAGAAGSLGVSAALAPWRPHLLALTGLFLLGGFWAVYRKPKQKCCDSGVCATEAAARRRKVNIGVMWVVAAFSHAMAAYPKIIASRVRAAGGEQQVAPLATEATFVFHVGGMDCEACAAPIKTSVEKLPGVRSARVNFRAKSSTVIVTKAATNSSEILAVVKQTGFRATEWNGDRK